MIVTKVNAFLFARTDDGVRILNDRQRETVAAIRRGNLSPLPGEPGPGRGTIQAQTFFAMPTTKRATKTTARNRPRNKVAAPESAPLTVPEPVAALTGNRNVGELEAMLSMGMGVLFVVAALFPRSIKQLVMLSLGGGLLYRGMTGHCGVYEAAGIDTTNEQG